jgi:dolichyl-phosphate-mannose--protein O-mannosyl transferase
VNVERGALIVLGIAALVIIVRLNDPPAGYAQPGDPPVYVHDECYQAFTAERYALGDREAWNPFATRATMAKFATGDMGQWTVYEWVHPPTAKLIMAGFIKLFGFQPTAYRLGSALFGILTLLLTWRLGVRMRGAEFGLVALVLIAADGLVFTMSRIAMNDIYCAACILGAMLALYRWWTEDKPLWLALAGVTFGIGLTMKWSAGPLWVSMGAIAAARIAWEALSGKRGGRALAWTAAAWVGGFIVAPPILYLASYIPYFLSDYTWADFEMLNKQIWWYHQQLKATHSMSSRWWEWPLVTRPVWFFLHPEVDQVRLIYGMGNPILWWAFLPSLAWVAIRWLRKREPADGLILCGFFGLWLPWAFVGRVAFLQYLLPAVPFGALAVATALTDLRAGLKRVGGVVFPLYMVGVVAVFINFYPMWSAYPISAEDFKGHRYFWFEAWRKP